MDEILLACAISFTDLIDAIEEKGENIELHKMPFRT